MSWICFFLYILTIHIVFITIKKIPFFQIITVEASQVTYFGTKVEIKMKKAELLSWSKVGRIIESKERHESEKKSTGATESIVDQVEAVELNDL